MPLELGTTRPPRSPMAARRREPAVATPQPNRPLAPARESEAASADRRRVAGRPEPRPWRTRSTPHGPRSTSATLAGIDGIVGSLVDHLEIEPGAEAAVAAALGDAMHAIVVDGDPAARRRGRRGSPAATRRLLLGSRAARSAATPRHARVRRALSPTPARTQPLAELACAPSCPDSQATLARLLAGVVLVDGDWRTAVDLAIDHPQIDGHDPAGDRFGGRGPWRLGGEPVSGITPAALDEAEDAGDPARVALGAAAEAAVASARRPSTNRAATRPRRRQACGASSRCGPRRSDERREVLAGRLAGVEDRLAARDPEAKADGRALPQRDLARRSTRTARSPSGSTRRAAASTTCSNACAQERRRAGRARPARPAASSRRSAPSGPGSSSELAGAPRAPAAPRGRRRREPDAARGRVERIRTDFDCEPGASRSTRRRPRCPKAPRSPGEPGTSTASCELMGPINPLALEEYDALLGASRLPAGAARRREEQPARAAAGHQGGRQSRSSRCSSRRSPTSQENFTAALHHAVPRWVGSGLPHRPGDMLNTGIEMEARPSGKNSAPPLAALRR